MKIRSKRYGKVRKAPQWRTHEWRIKAMKDAAAARNQTMTAVIESAIDQYLAGTEFDPKDYYLQSLEGDAAARLRTIADKPHVFTSPE